MIEQTRQERIAELNKKLNPSDYIEKIMTSEAYAAPMDEMRGGPKPDAESFAIKHGLIISQAAEALARESESQSGRKTFEGQILDVISHLPQFMQSQIALNKMRESHASYREKAPHLDTVVRLNHSLKELVDTNPLLQFSQVLRFLNQMNAAINGKGHSELFTYEARSILVGMRHEIAVEQMLGTMPDVEYQDTDLASDLKGSDIFVSINGSPYVPIDVKASFVSAEKAKQKAAAYGYNPNLIIWSQLYEEDFGDSFRIPHETVMERKDRVYDQLVMAVESETVQYASHS
jgi:hypothetical protein